MKQLPYLDLQRATRAHRAAIRAACDRVVESGWFILGKELSAFETEWADFCATDHAVGTGNGLDGLELVLAALDLPPGTEVIVPSNTYIATWLAVTNSGLTVHPVEPDPRTHNLTAEAVAAHIGPRTGAVLGVHLFGQLADDRIHTVCQDAGIPVIFDAAQAHGARSGNTTSGSMGDAAVFSFYPTKNLGAMGDGGAVTTDNVDLAQRVRLLRNYGSEKKYENRERGRNSRLDEMQAAVLRARLNTLEAENLRRREIASGYARHLASIDAIRVPLEPDDRDRHVWHAFNIQCRNTHEREVLRTHLEQRGIGTQVFYPIPPHMSRAYRDHGWPPEAFPIARAFAEDSLAIPMAPYLTDSEVSRVVESIATCLL